MKRVIVEAFFPELKGGNIYKVGRGQGATSRPAIARAFADALRQVRGKRITTIKATVTIVDVQQHEEAKGVNLQA